MLLYMYNIDNKLNVLHIFCIYTMMFIMNMCTLYLYLF